MVRRLSKAEIRTTTAYHEAAHAVVAAHYGWWIIEPGIRIDSGSHVQFRCHVLTATAAARIVVSLAGELAARIHYGIPLCSDRSTADFDHMYDDIIEEWDELDGDEIDAMRVLIDRYPDMVRQRLYRLFERVEKQTLRFIQRPEIWSRVDGLATTLIERGNLNAPDATAAMAGLGCW